MAFDYRSGIEDVIIREMPDVVISPSQLPLPVTNVPSATYTTKVVFNAITSVASGIETTIVSYTVPVGKKVLLHKSDMSGTNVSKFTMYLNGNPLSVQRVYYTEFNAKMDFSGLYLTGGDILVLKVIHNMSSLGDFEANIQIDEEN
jgi:hypothetical protein